MLFFILIGVAVFVAIILAFAVIQSGNAKRAATFIIGIPTVLLFVAVLWVFSIYPLLRDLGVITP